MEQRKEACLLRMLECNGQRRAAPRPFCPKNVVDGYGLAETSSFNRLYASPHISPSRLFIYGKLFVFVQFHYNTGTVWQRHSALATISLVFCPRARPCSLHHRPGYALIHARGVPSRSPAEPVFMRGAGPSRSPAEPVFMRGAGPSRSPAEGSSRARARGQNPARSSRPLVKYAG